MENDLNISWWRLNTHYFDNRHHFFKKYAFCLVIEDDADCRKAKKKIKWLIDFIKSNSKHNFRIDSHTLDDNNLFDSNGVEFIFNFENKEDANTAWVWCSTLCNLMVNQT